MRLIIALLALITLTGCGHNVATLSKGVRFNVGINPDTYMMSIGFDYGENVTVALKENAEAEYQGETTAAAGTGAESSGEVSTGSRLTIKTGDQVTGYRVDLERARAAGEIAVDSNPD